MATRTSQFAVTKHGDVWMTVAEPNISASRAVAVDVMMELGIDALDFRTRDKIILAISRRIDGMLTYARRRKK